VPMSHTGCSYTTTWLAAHCLPGSCQVGKQCLAEVCTRWARHEGSLLSKYRESIVKWDINICVFKAWHKSVLTMYYWIWFDVLAVLCGNISAPHWCTHLHHTCWIKWQPHSSHGHWYNVPRVLCGNISAPHWCITLTESSDNHTLGMATGTIYIITNGNSLHIIVTACSIILVNCMKLC